MKLFPISKDVKGVLNTKQVVGGTFLLFSLLAMLASFMLSIEALFEARHPGAVFSCDLNALLSCSTVAASDQAEIVGKIIPFFGGFTVPNAFFGMIFEAVFITIAVLLAFGGKKFKLPKWFATLSVAGNFLALIFAYWLLYQSSFVIGALCPWCLLLMVSTTCQFFAQLQYAALSDNLPLSETASVRIKSFISKGYWLMLNIVIILAIAIFIVLKYGRRLISG